MLLFIAILATINSFPLGAIFSVLAIGTDYMLRQF
jgi:hypothetical protein